jgi:hypothetical protein
MPLTLWRLEGATTEFLPDATGLAAGLRLHLAHAPLTSTLVQIGDVQRAYVALDGCGGCLRGRCEPGCRVELLRRLLRASLDGATLQTVPRGLAACPYARVALAWPGRNARPPAGAILAAWEEARLSIHWQRGPRATITVSALLATGVGEGDPARILTELGWNALPLPPSLLSRIERGSLPLLKVGRVWHNEPTLLLPAAGEVVPAATEQSPPATDELADAPTTSPLAQALDRILALAREPAPATGATTGLAGTREADAAGSPWPAGPGRMRPAEVATLVERLLSDPAIIAATPPGVTKGRLRDLVEPGLAEPLLAWLDAAGVLAEPSRPELRWREPRPLRECEPEAIAEGLRRTPLPDDPAVQAALGGGR